MKNIKSFNLFNEEANEFNPWNELYNEYKEATKKNKDEAFIWHLAEIGYKKWQENQDWSKMDMYNFFKQHYTPEYALIVMLKNYIGQVYNGGHAQYSDNGYDGSREGGAFSRGTGEKPIHDEMVELFKTYDYANKITNGQEVLNVMQKFDIEPAFRDCEWCGGSGYYEEEDDEDDGYGYGGTQETCDQCRGDGEIEDEGETSVVNSNSLDDELYKVADDFITGLNKYTKQLMYTDIKKEVPNVDDLAKFDLF